MKRPDNLCVDNEIFSIYEHPDIPSPMIDVTCGFNLSPFEAHELLEWLQKYEEYLDWWHKENE